MKNVRTSVRHLWPPVNNWDQGWVREGAPKGYETLRK